MNRLQLIKSAEFGGVPCDFYGRDNEVFMTSDQLAQCLEYADRRGVDKLVERNDYLKSSEFSTTVNLSVVEGGRTVTRERRIFTEDGIYEVTMLAKTEKAKEFRAWVRTILKSLRTGKTKLVGMTEYQQMMAETRQRNARIQSARILTKLAEHYKGTTYEQVLNAHATKELTGDYLLPLPRLEAKTFSAAEIGERLGITANKVGIIANRHGLKTSQYGALFNDKSRHSAKEVQTFRYFANVIPEFERIIGVKSQPA